MSSLYETYKKVCPSCKKEALIPNQLDICQECLVISLKLDSTYQFVCLDCGKVTSNVPPENKFCLNCLRGKYVNSCLSFKISLSDEQRKAFEELLEYYRIIREFGISLIDTK